MKRLLFGLIAMLALGALALPGAAAAKDRDRDGLPDRWEKRNGLSTKHSSGGRDNDRDRVDNRNEYRERTRPRDADTDNDGKRDGAEDADRDKLRNAAEDATGNDPVDSDTDNDGVSDGREHAGTIRSFADDGLLTIDLSHGDVLRGWVTDQTRVKCTSEAQAEKEYRLKFKARASMDDEEMLDEEVLDEDMLDEDLEGDEDLDEDLDDSKDWEEDEGKYEHSECSANWLDAGRHVRQAYLSLTEDGLVFDKIELVK
jgi:hypothetical protein